MPRGMMQLSQATRVAKWVIANVYSTTADVAFRFAITMKQAENILRGRANTVGDIARSGRVWRATSPAGYPTAPLVTRLETGESAGGAPAGAERPAIGDTAPVVHAIVQRRTPPPFVEWSGAMGIGPIRPGARDFESIPSRIGNERVPYHTAQRRSS